ncbi:MAG TPA: hypothetical protein VGH87_14345 [Polyangiaceae bacterium]
MNDIPLGVLLGVGIPVFVLLVGGTIAYLVISAVQKATARTRAELEREGVIMDTGRTWVTIRLNGFRGYGVAVGVGVYKERGAFVLSKQRLVLVPSRRRFPQLSHADLAQFDVSADGGQLVLHTDHPPNATGTMDVRVTVSDPNAWVKALTEAGAKPANLR